ncbi:ribonuclease H-like domain-containing protein [Tanacetum coccineum]
MTNPDQPSAPPTLTLVEKLYAVHNINTLVPEKLDLAESNYSTWSYFFKGHCSNFGVLKHIEGSSTQSSTSTPPTDDWITADSIVKSWIFLTLSSTLRKRLIKANPKTAKDAWDTIEAIFQDNKRTRVVALRRATQDDVVTYAINGLSDKYGSLAQIIAHKEPFPDLSTVRSMVSTEEMRIRNKSHSLSVSTNSSAPQVLLTETPHRVQDTRTNKERDNRNNNKTELFGHKHNADGSLNRYKARLVANEHHLNVVHQLDVKNAFLHGSLSKTVYMHQPPGFRDPRHPDHVCLLQRSLYGALKQGPRAWFQRFALMQARFASAHHCNPHAEFSMTDLGPLNYFLGVSVTRNTSGMFLSQQKYATEVLERAGMLTCNPCRTPVDTNSKLAATGDPVSDPTLYRRLAWALRYLTFTWPDISYAVQQVCLFMHDPREPHFSALKRILRYVYGTLTSGL